MRRLLVERLIELRNLYTQQAKSGYGLPWSEDLASALNELIQKRESENVAKKL